MAVARLEAGREDWRVLDRHIKGGKRLRLRMSCGVFLKIADGRSELVALYESLYTGPLARFRCHEVSFIPHLALGLFVKKGAAYDMSAAPQATNFDEPSYRRALEEAEAEHIDLECRVERLDLVEIPRRRH